MKQSALAKVKKTVPKTAKSLNKPPAPKTQKKEAPKKKRSFDDFLSVRNR